MATKIDFLEAFAKTKDVNPDLSFSEWLDEYLGKIGIEPEIKNFFKENAMDPTINYEEVLQKGIQIGMEFVRIEQKQN